MGCSHNLATVGTEFFDDAESKCCALRRVCTCTKFVHKHKAFFVCLLEYLADIFHMAGESGQTLFDTLFITDINENIFEHTYRTAFVCRNKHTCTSHSTQQTCCFEGNSFTACVRTCDNHCVVAEAQFYIRWHNLCFIDKRMTGFLKAELKVWVNLWHNAVHAHGKFCLCHNHINLQHLFVTVEKQSGILCYHCRKSGKNFIDFILFFIKKLHNFVVQVCNCRRFDKVCGT